MEKKEPIVDPLKEYNFHDEDGYPILNCLDYIELVNALEWSLRKITEQSSDNAVQMMAKHYLNRFGFEGKPFEFNDEDEGYFPDDEDEGHEDHDEDED